MTEKAADLRSTRRFAHDDLRPSGHRPRMTQMDHGLNRCRAHPRAHALVCNCSRADTGCDFDFLRSAFGAPVAEPPIF